MLQALNEIKRELTQGLVADDTVAELRMSFLRARDLLANVIRGLPATQPDYVLAIYPAELASNDRPIIHVYFVGGRPGTSKIYAIKAVRERDKVGLKAAKDYVDRLQAKAQHVLCGDAF